MNRYEYQDEVNDILWLLSGFWAKIDNDENISQIKKDLIIRHVWMADKALELIHKALEDVEKGVK